MNVTLIPKEQTRLQVLNSLMAEQMTLDQAAIMMGVRARHTRRILGAYREKGAAALLVDIIELMPAWGNIPVSNIEQFGMWMMVKRCRVRLAEEEQQELRALVSKGRAAAYKQTHARILLLSNEGHGGGAMQDEEIARSLKVGIATVERVRRRCVEAGVEAALGRKEQLNRRQKRLDGQGEAHPVSSTGAGSDCPGLRRAAPSAPLRAGSGSGQLDA